MTYIWLMGFSISRAAVEAMLAHAAVAMPHECCGVLTGPEHDRVTALIESPNVANDPARRFEIAPDILIAAEKAARAGGAQIVGYYHSHPNGDARPSATDAAQSARDGRIWVIVAGGELTCWRNLAGGAVHEVFDSVEWEILSPNSVRAEERSSSPERA